MRPIRPAIPKAAMEGDRLTAPFGLLVEVEEAAEEPFVVAEDPPEFAAVVEAADESVVPVEAAAPPEAPTVTAVLRQLESEPGRIVNEDEKAVTPVLSFRAILKFVLA